MSGRVPSHQIVPNIRIPAVLAILYKIFLHICIPTVIRFSFHFYPNSSFYCKSDFHFREKGNRNTRTTLDYKFLLYCVSLISVSRPYSSSSCNFISKFHYIVPGGVPSLKIVLHNRTPVGQAILYLIFISDRKVTGSLQMSIILCLVAYRPI